MDSGTQLGRERVGRWRNIHSTKDVVAIFNLTEDLDGQIIDFWTLWEKARVG